LGCAAAGDHGDGNDACQLELIRCAKLSLTTPASILRLIFPWPDALPTTQPKVTKHRRQKLGQKITKFSFDVKVRKSETIYAFV